MFCLWFKAGGCTHTVPKSRDEVIYAPKCRQAVEQIRYISSVYSSKEAESRGDRDHKYWDLQNGLYVIKMVYRQKDSSFKMTQRQELKNRYQTANWIGQIH